MTKYSDTALFRTPRQSLFLVLMKVIYSLCFVLAICTQEIAYAQAETYSMNYTAPTFKAWTTDLEKNSSTFKRFQRVWIESLDSEALLIAIYPKQIDVEALNWVGKGGHLFLALNAQSVKGAQTFLQALDLKAIPQKLLAQNIKASELAKKQQITKKQQIKGAWPFPSDHASASKFTNYLMTPWLTVDPLAFIEGSSWFKGSIPPIAIDEQGQSIAYRVRYGKGILTLFGDADALSDQLSILPENRRFSQAILWWITHPYPTKKQNTLSDSTQPTINISFVDPQGKVISKVKEENLQHRLSELLQEIKNWWNEHPLWQFNLYSHIRYLVIALSLTYLILLLWLGHSSSWQRLFILRKK